MRAPELVLSPWAIHRDAYASQVASSFRALDVFQVNELTADSARLVVNFDQHARGWQRLIIISMDGATEAAQHILLKTLEEPRARFILLASVLPLPTVVSRCQVRHLQASRPEPTEAETVAAARVATVLRTVWNRDHAALARVLRNWDEGHPPQRPPNVVHEVCLHQMLIDWAAQCSSGRFRPPLSMPAGTSFQPAFGRALLVELSRHGFARPRLAAQAALADMASRGA